MTIPRRASVACIGVGRWGRNLARVFAAEGALAAIVDPDGATADEISRKYSVPAFSKGIDLENLRQLGIEAVAIATPAETHASLALAALEGGFDVFVEKPMALDVAAAETCARAAAEHDRVLMVGHLLLYHPAIIALEHLIREGELGEIRYIYSNRLNLGRVRREENILWSFAPHDIAVILHLLGSEPIGVRAVGGTWLQPGVSDVTVTHLDFASGAKAHVFVSWLHPSKEQRLVVVGSSKMAVFNDLDPEAKLRVVDSGVDIDPDGRPLERQGSSRIIAIDGTEPLAIECRHFLECCETRRRPLTDSRHGIAVMRVLAAAQSSL